MELQRTVRGVLSFVGLVMVVEEQGKEVGWKM